MNKTIAGDGWLIGHSDPPAVSFHTAGDRMPQSGKGDRMSLEFAKAAAIRAEARQLEERQQFNASEVRREAFSRYSGIWFNWSDAWRSVAEAMNADQRETAIDLLAAAFQELADTVVLANKGELLGIAAKNFDPAYCHESASTADLLRADGTKQLLDIAASILDKKSTALKLAREMLEADPAIDLSQAGGRFAVDMIRLADKWPIQCIKCGRTMLPTQLGRSNCESCRQSGLSAVETAIEWHSLYPRDWEIITTMVENHADRESAMTRREIQEKIGCEPNESLDSAFRRLRKLGIIDSDPKPGGGTFLTNNAFEQAKHRKETQVTL